MFRERFDVVGTSSNTEATWLASGTFLASGWTVVWLIMLWRYRQFQERLVFVALIASAPVVLFGWVHFAFDWI